MARNMSGEPTMRGPYLAFAIASISKLPPWITSRTFSRFIVGPTATSPFLVHEPDNPDEAAPPSWNMNHMWMHWLDDVAEIRKRFPNLHCLQLKIGYHSFTPNTLANYVTWAPLMFQLPGEALEAMEKRIIGVLKHYGHLAWSPYAGFRAIGLLRLRAEP
ncbi:hypothetical protein BU23DRAFT_570791 [Bimuria novae-zelandiae CBS 107.79]|uniref:Uncharacterized protein n=1 Tax=Bimuria novae-zelandiae CBS 107.79 TaxID=1447943 RepID=A0A6A5V059_9PLEO|nr:hypothetical protein BU23DRAFT_570791 [Bimuria novae-zelandiae CBS 107.79]